MNAYTAGSPATLVVCVVFVVLAMVCADRKAFGPATFFGLLSLVLTMLFCCAQILKAMAR